MSRKDAGWGLGGGERKEKIYTEKKNHGNTISTLNVAIRIPVFLCALLIILCVRFSTCPTLDFRCCVCYMN